MDVEEADDAARIGLGAGAEFHKHGAELGGERRIEFGDAVGDVDGLVAGELGRVGESRQQDEILLEDGEQIRSSGAVRGVAEEGEGGAAKAIWVTLEPLADGADGSGGV